jgi:cysteine desulfurase
MKKIYADYNATSPVADSHFDFVCQKLKEIDGNPSSIHSFGREAKIYLEDSRENIAEHFSCDAQEIIFTSGGTEGNNLIIQGVVGAAQGGSKLPHVIISSLEHASVKNCAELLEERGLCSLTVIPVAKSGLLDFKLLVDAIKDETCLVSIIAVNNEIGTVNQIEKFATELKEKNKNIHFHSDAVQAFGKIDLKGISNSSVDSLSVSAHKIGAYKGVGAVYLKRGLALNALIVGGGQERSRRGGTENIPGIVSFGQRSREILDNPGWLDHCDELRSMLISKFSQDVRVKCHGDLKSSLQTTLNFHVDGVGGEELLLNFDIAGIAVSSGSACSSGVARPSSVLLAIGCSEWEALNSIRISLGFATSKSDVQSIVDVFEEILQRSR